MSIALTILVFGILLLGLRYPLLILGAVWMSNSIKLVLAYHAPVFQKFDFMIVTLAFAVVAFGMRLLLDPKKVQFPRNIILLFLAMVGWHSMSFLWGPKTPYAMEYLIKGSVIGTAWFLIPFVYIVSVRHVERFMRLIFWSASIMAIGTVFFPSGFNPWRATFLTGNPLAQATAMTMGILAALTLVLYTTSGIRQRWLYWLGIPILVGGIIATGSRGPVITGGFGILVFFIFARSHLGLGKWSLFALISGIAILVVIIFVPAGYLQRISTIFSVVEGSAVTGREDLWSFAWKGIVQQPLLGHGLGGFASDLGELAGYPHNIFLDLWYESGIIGLSLVVAFFLFIFIICIHRIKQLKGYKLQIIPIGALSMFISNLAEQCKTGGWMDYRFLWMLAGLCLVSSQVTILEHKEYFLDKQSFSNSHEGNLNPVWF